MRWIGESCVNGGSAARRLGGSAARRLGGSAARRLGGSAARRLGGSAARRLVKVSVAQLEVPAAKPPLAALGVDLDGRLWVTLSRFADSTHIADVYTPDGEFIERREWPGDISLSLFAATDNSALGVQQDSLGIERVVRMSFRESR